MEVQRRTFTARQRQVIELIAAGCSNEEIGRRLGLSPRTAKAHSDVLRRKLGVRARRQIPAAYRLLTGEDPWADLPAVLAPATKRETVALSADRFGGPVGRSHARQ